MEVTESLTRKKRVTELVAISCEIEFVVAVSVLGAGKASRQGARRLVVLWSR